VFENRVPRILDLREEVTGGWRRLHNEFHNLYASLNIISVSKSRRIKWAGNVARTAEIANAYHVSVGKSERKRLLERPRRRREDNIRMDLTEIWWVGVDWINLA
jgi:hypothetical protein